MNNPPYLGATEGQIKHPMVQELLAVHNMFRSRLEAILIYVDKLMANEHELGAPETQREVQALIQAGSQYSQMLHMHHTLETSSLFPRLENEGLEGTVIEKLNSDHNEIGVLIDQFSLAIHQLSTVKPEVMKHDLRRLSEALREHLAYEETHICPYLARLSSWH